MSQLSLQQFAPLFVIVLLIVWTQRRSRFEFGDLSHFVSQTQRWTLVLLIRAARRLSQLGLRSDDLVRLRDELQRHMPVYSAETVRGTEAEFIRDDLPKKLPIGAVIVALVVFVIVAWWLR